MKGYDKQGYIYDLYGIINHSGNLMGGHYWSYIKNANGNWYTFNDTIVKQMEVNKLISVNAYCLFYKKKIN